ncbi:MAG: hypothetical protein ACNYPE_04585 [Candidatus Azotimanducaceae bacterium WSBS_2022_MAG_OTU7]
MNEPPHPTRSQLLRHVLVFQFKLAMDGLRDVLLSPISLLAALAGILTSHPDPSRYFKQLLQLGHRSDKWINLFDTHDEESESLTSDDFVRKAESIVLGELEKGGVIPKLKRTSKKPENPLPVDHPPRDHSPEERK